MKLYEVIIFGILVSIIFYEITDISPGGIIVPGYISLYFNQPIRIFITILLSLITLKLVNILSNYTILYGRRKFSFMVVVSFIVGYLFRLMISSFSIPVFISINIIGYIIPGIIAQDMSRQGIVKTLTAMTLVTIFIKVMNIAFLSGGLI